MLGFEDFLTEAKRNNMKGRISGAESGKVLSHIRRYVLPFLDQKQRMQAAKVLGPHMDVPTDEAGEHHKQEISHTIGSKHGENESGTPVKVTGIDRVDPDGTVHVKTKDHGVVPMSKLNKPEGLAKAAVGREGFKVEDQINGHWGSKSAGSTRHAYDYSLGGSERKAAPVVRGKVKETEPEYQKPIVRGESKLEKGKMGQGVVSFNKEKGWQVTHPDPQMAHFMANAQVDGVPLLKYMNLKHPEGKIDKGFSIKAPKGMAREYLRSTGANSLHIHNKERGAGTSFTFGDNNELLGKTKLGHLTNDDLDALDGTLAVEKSGSGSSTIIHRPKAAKMREYASASQIDPENHRDLTKKDHAMEFHGHVMGGQPTQAAPTAQAPVAPSPQRVKSFKQVTAPQQEAPQRAPAGGFGQNRGEGPRSFAPSGEVGGFGFRKPGE